MKTVFRGTFVIPWAQTELDGQRSAPVDDIAPGRTWRWTGEATRVDGPRGVLPLGNSEGSDDLRRRAGLNVRRLLQSMDIYSDLKAPVQDPLFDRNIIVTDGYDTWTVSVIPAGLGRKPLLMFHCEIPPREQDLWIVKDTVDAATRHESAQKAIGVICFTPGTMIATPWGPRDVASLMEGDKVQTRDNGSAEILWLGARKVTGARLKAIPELTPVRLRAGSLDDHVPDEGLLVSPDHKMVLQGPRAKALYNAEEVLVTARDLIDDQKILRDYSVKSVTYIHMMLERHEIVFANGVATESFHPSSAALASMGRSDQDRLYDRMPELRGNTDVFGPYARRVLSESETAIMQHYARNRH